MSQKILFTLYFIAAIFLQNVEPEKLPNEIIKAIYVKNMAKAADPFAKQLNCETHGCIRTASKVLSYLNESVDPCENFYDFACGGFLRNTVLPDHKKEIDSFAIVADLVQDQLRTILNEPIQPNEPKAFRLAKQFNLACLNETIIEKRGIKPLVDLLEEFGGWPVVKGDSWADDAFDWVETIKKMTRLGLDSDVVFYFGLVADSKNSTKNVLYVSNS